MKFLITFCLFILSPFAIAQIENNPDFDKMFTYLINEDFDSVKVVLDDKFIKSPNRINQVIGNVFMSVAYLNEAKEVDKALNSLKKAETIAKQSDNKLELAYVDYGYFMYYYKNGIIRLGNDSFKKCLTELKKHPNQNLLLSIIYKDLININWNTPTNHDHYNNAKEAYTYALKSNDVLIKALTTTIYGVTYLQKHKITQSKNDADSMLHYLNEALSFSQKIKDPTTKNVFMARSYINLATAYNQLNKTDEVIKYTTLSYNIAKVTPKSEYDLPYIYNNFGNIYLTKKEFAQAIEYYQKAYDEINKNLKKFPNANKHVGVTVVENLVQVYEAINDYKNAVKYQKIKNDLLIENFTDAKEKDIKSLEIQFETEKKNEELKQLQLVNSANKREQLFYIVTSVLAFLISGSLFFFLRNKIKNKKQKVELLEAQNFETELNLLLEKEEKARLKAEQELLVLQQEKMQKTVLANSLKLDKKNSLINDIKEKVDTKTEISTVLKKDITVNDINAIEKLIKDIHPNFFNRLNEVAVKKLTNLDLKYASYIYLNMNNQQIANMLKVDSKTVRMTKYRLKQKLGLEKVVDLGEFIQNMK